MLGLIQVYCFNRTFMELKYVKYSEKNRLLNAIYNAGKYDTCIELDKDCYEVKEQKKEETDDWLKDFKLE